jgi:3-hydroxymyristoyl/3-hydroxydecanoyl-(acyl carrier protein) dehydratase
MPDVIEVQFAPDHPTAAGHFPGNPIIPGALLLDAVLQAAGTGPGVIRSAKFLLPLRPGEPMRVHWETLASGAVTFECRRALDAALLASGIIEMA